MPRNVRGNANDIPLHGEVDAWPARLQYAAEAGRRAAIKLSGRAMPPATLDRPGPHRNRVWVVLHDGTAPLPVASAAGIQSTRAVTTWHACALIVSDAVGIRVDAVFHAFGSWSEAHACVDAAGRDWE